jgi:hypothetical protein
VIAGQRATFGLRARAEPVALHETGWDTPPFDQTMLKLPVPPLPDTAALAAWLDLSPSMLDWFADCQGREAKVPAGPLRHYTYRWQAKRLGKARLLEMPKQRLKALQRRILHKILDPLLPHPAVHSYCADRSIASYVAPHTGRRLVLRMDLRDFFPSIRPSRVHALFLRLCYPTSVARLLTGLCTNVVPLEVCEAAPELAGHGQLSRQRLLFHRAHLPQGAPTSPALANFCAYNLDCRLTALARAAGAHYTRYADDLAFSGDAELERCARRLHVLACRIALEEGFEVHTRKTRFMRQAIRQQLCGVVVNHHTNLRRDEYDRLKAILHNCIRHGPGSQNRANHPNFQAYLLGRIAYVAMLNPAHGRRLRIQFDQIQWEGRD